MDRFAQRLLLARRLGVPAAWREGAPVDARQAYAVQDATLAELGAIGGWKVDAPGPGAEPTCAPLPAKGLHADGARVRGVGWALRGIEVEVAFRLGRGIDGSAGPPGLEEMRAAVAAVLPAIEVIETRLQDWRASPPLAQLADLQSHGALVLGAPAPLPAADVDLRQLVAYLAFDGQPVASARGAHALGDPWCLLAWLAVHCSRRGQPLRAGQVVATGSCTGLLFAPEGARVDAELQGIGRVGLQL